MVAPPPVVVEWLKCLQDKLKCLFLGQKEKHESLVTLQRTNNFVHWTPWCFCNKVLRMVRGCMAAWHNLDPSNVFEECWRAVSVWPCQNCPRILHVANHAGISIFCASDANDAKAPFSFEFRDLHTSTAFNMLQSLNT